MNRSNTYAKLRAMQLHIARTLGVPVDYTIAENQTPPKRNGGRSTFKQNRRAQIKANNR